MRVALVVVVVVLAVAPPAPADPARVVTEPPNVLAPIAVDGVATINDGDQAGTWYFELVATWYSDSTQPQAITGSPDDQQVSGRLGVISDGTTYRYRVVFNAPDGPVYGDWVEFTTPRAPIIKVHPPIPRLEFSSTRLHIARNHTIPVRLGCRPTPDPCTGTITLKTSDAPDARVLTMPHGFRIKPGMRALVHLRLARAGRRLIGRNGLNVFVEARGLYGPMSLTGTDRPLSLR